MLCPSCREHFQYSRKAQRECLRLKRDAIETLQRASASHDAIECLLNDADAFARDSGRLCPWIRRELPALPEEVHETTPEIKIWNSRKGADIADGSRLGCELCARICFMVSYMPKFRAGGSNQDHQPQVPSPDNILPLKVDSQLELYPITLQPKRILLVFKGLLEGDIKYFNIYLRHESLVAPNNHAWGQENFLTLTKQNVEDMMNGIDFPILPRCFQDAITLTMQLGGRYLWIDSLCIIQDSPEDWVIESGLMHKVYSNGICNLAASNQSSSNPGLFCPRDPAMGAPFTVECSWSDHLESLTVFADLVELVTRHSPLYKRGWVTQEQALSPRTVHMAAFPMWECRQRILSEMLPSGDYCVKYDSLATTSKFCPDTQGEDFKKYWGKTVFLYSKCALTQESDKLVALCGIAKTLSEHLGQEYYAGIWASCLLSGLLWQVQKFINGVDMDTVRYATYIAPSWSWASVEGPIQYFHYIITAPLVDVLSVETQPRNGDHFGQLEGGTLTMYGVMFEFPSLTLLMGDWDSLSSDVRFNELALSLDDCGKHYYEFETWFLPLAQAHGPSFEQGLDIHGILLQKATESSTTSNFTRVGRAVVNREGEIAGSGRFIKNWIQQPWSQEHYCTVTIE
ncbi:hypothetical protein FDECE_51 [Fusarium decemcellulare]|nr:hypothetical protein FDECE_51 [Fusarium decemcellulare]